MTTDLLFDLESQVRDPLIEMAGRQNRLASDRTAYQVFKVRGVNNLSWLMVVVADYLE